MTQTDDIGRDLTPALGPEQVLERFETALEPIESANDTASHYRVPIEVADAAATLIRQQAAQLTEAQAGGWISVQERLPEDGETDIICVFNTGDVYPVTTIFEGGDLYLRLYTGARVAIFKPSAITHWMPLPAPPAQEASDGK